MKKIKFLSMIALVAILAACNKPTDPTVIRFTTTPGASVSVGALYTYTATVKVDNPNGNTVMTEMAIPAWLSFTDNGSGSATISGTPTAAEVGTYSFTITATNNGVSTSQEISLRVTEGGVDPDPAGDGTQNNPYNVTSAIANQGGSKFVKGYIVGYVWALSPITYFYSADTCHQKTNVIIAASPNETDNAKCLPVQLPSGSIRTGVNLQDTKANLGLEVTFYGSLESYFSAPGLKNTSYYKFADGREGGSVPVDPTGAVLNETLLTQASYDTFSAYSVSGTQAWTFSTSYGAMMSGYEANASHANEDWFISPAMDLTGKSGIITFDHARGPAGSMSVSTDNYTVWVSNNYTTGAAPSTATWTQIPITNHGTVAWGFVQAGPLTIPAANKAANARIAFKYVCNDTESATWEVKNVIVK